MRTLWILIILLLPFPAEGHGGEDHGAAPAATLPAVSYFSSEAASDKYEVLVKYGRIEPGQALQLKIFIANVITNAPINPRLLRLSVPGLDGELKVRKVDNGIFETTVTLPEKKAYSLNVSLDGPSGPDLIQVTGIEAGKELPEAHAGEDEHTPGWIYLVAGAALGSLIVLAVLKLRNRRGGRVAMGLVLLLSVLPVGMPSVSAHGGEDHGDGAGAAGGSLSAAFRVEKESQFLFGFLTERAGGGEFSETIDVMGTVVPAPGGSAVIQSPQTAKIVALNVRPGQRVGKGQILVTLEQQVDAGTQLDIISQKNAVNAEYHAAKTQYERLKAIEDIAARKDVTEARARFLTAQENKRLFEANMGRGSGNTKIVHLIAPIAGVTGTFNYAVGAVVNAGETLFEITNLSNIYVEAQVFGENLSALQSATGFTTRSENAENPMDYTLSLVAQPQAVNAENQSLRVFFSLNNPVHQLKIGEKLTVSIRTGSKKTGLLVPDEAITDVNGKPAVFIKDRAEQFSVSFVRTGAKNSSHTEIISGAEDGEKIVVRNVYELKMIYLNQ